MAQKWRVEEKEGLAQKYEDMMEEVDVEVYEDSEAGSRSI